MGETAATPAVFSTGMLIGGTALHAAGLFTASAQDTGVELGKGKFKIVTTITAIEVDTTGEAYIIDIEASTRAAPTVWFTLGTAFAGGKADTTKKVVAAAGTYVTIVENPYDYLVRVTLSVLGSPSTGINFTVDAYPVESNA
jgi:hypothetical protein